jgi:two-component system CheB/CheR fusion protein
VSQEPGHGAIEEPRWKLLAAAEHRLQNAKSVEEVIAIVRSSARAICSADGVTVVLRDGRQCHYVEEDAVSPLWKGQRFPMELCISGWAMLNAKTAAIEDIFEDPRIPHDVYRKTFVKSLVMAPAPREEPLAAVGAYWADRRLMTERETAAVETLADAVGRAIKRIYLGG